MQGIAAHALADAPVAAGAALGLAILIAAGEALRSRAGWAPESTRRLVHAGTGLFVFASPWLFEGAFWLYLLGTGFSAFNVVAVRRRWLKGMHGIARKSWGTVSFPLALLVLLPICWGRGPEARYAFQTAFVILALADPAASWVGGRARRSTADEMPGTTWPGSLAFFAVTLALGIVCWSLWGKPGLTALLAWTVGLGLVATAVEALGTRGWDNLFVALACAFWVILIQEPRGIDPLTALAAGVGFGVVTWRIGFLSPSGAIAGALLGTSLLAVGGWSWTIPALGFFLFSSLLSVIGRRRKQRLAVGPEKGSRRDAGQVYANGGVAWALLLLFMVWPHPTLYWGFVASFAAAAADTWSTEIGTAVGGRTRLLLSRRPVRPGLSGGVSWAGLGGAVLGAASIAACVWFAAPAVLAALGPGRAFVALVVGGALGSLFDSLLGEWAQATYRAHETGALTDRALDHSGRPNELVSGRRWMTNDRVNVANTAFGAAFGLAFAFLA